MNTIQHCTEPLIRTATAAEYKQIVNWASAEGWNLGLDDARCLAALDPSALWVAAIDGQVVGCIAGCRWSPKFGAIGMNIVIPEQRGMGLSKLLWSRALQHASAPTVSIDAPSAQRGYYIRNGFAPAFRITRYQCSIPLSPHASAGLTSAESVDQAVLAAYDAKRFGVRREAFLAAWLHRPESVALCVVRNGQVTAFGAVGRAHLGSRVGPVFADDERDAEQLLCALCRQAPAAPVFLDVPECNRSAVRLVESKRLHQVFTVERMYQGDPWHIEWDAVYAVTTFGMG